MTQETTWSERGGAAITVRSVAIPSLDPKAVYDVTVDGGQISGIDQVGGSPGHLTLELWPGYVECHSHFALPANFDDSLDDARIIALQYLYHGVTHVIDMFGFPLVMDRFQQGMAESPLPYPHVVHCGYAVTSMRDDKGYSGHGVEFPAPVYMLGVEGDLDVVLGANSQRGATFLKIMFTQGEEQPGAPRRFSRLTARILANAAQVAAAHGMPAVLDCNTLEEVMQAYDLGFRLFAHSVRDVELSAADWQALNGAQFVSTLSGLRPMIMYPDDYLREYDRPGFLQTQDPENLDFVRGMTEPFGIEYGLQEVRTASLGVMRRNGLAALDRGVLRVGTDSGNTGAFHGFSLLGELDLLAGPDRVTDGLADRLRRAVTFDGLRMFRELSGLEPSVPISVGANARFNLLRPASAGQPLAELPAVTVVDGVLVNRDAIARDIAEFRSSQTKGKVIW
jgi:hypothetical protein